MVQLQGAGDEGEVAAVSAWWLAFTSGTSASRSRMIEVMKALANDGSSIV